MTAVRGDDDTEAAQLRSWVVDRDERALEVLIARHRPMVGGVCRRILGRTQLADEAEQDALSALAAQAARIRGNVGGWLRRAASRIALRHKRRYGRWGRLDDAAMGACAVPEGEPGMDLGGCLRRLPAGDRSLLVALFIEGRSVADLSAEYRISRQCLAQRRLRALGRIRRLCSSAPGRGVAVG